MILLVCWWVALRVITAPSLVHVTVVAGPPVEMQVKVLDWLLTVRLVTLGEPAWRYKQMVQMKFRTAFHNHTKLVNW